MDELVSAPSGIWIPVRMAACRLLSLSNGSFTGPTLTLGDAGERQAVDGRLFGPVIQQHETWPNTIARATHVCLFAE